MQYTWLKDKNGVEIYEWDIIQHQNDCADSAPYLVPELSPENWETLMGIWDSEWEVSKNKYSNIEILGNIYENPELLSD